MSVTATHFAGTRAILVELSDLQAVLALAARLDEAPLPGQLDVLAAAGTVLVKFDSRSAAKTAAATIGSLSLGSAPANTGKLVEIPVHYDGADLADVAHLTGLSTEAVIAAHTGQLWQAAFGGFAPGFAYLSGENRSLSVPRRATPRTNVPAGAVALAGDYSAIYPRKSPGGWQLIGHSDALLWSLTRESPALIRPMDRVRFVPARPSLSLRHDSAAGTAVDDSLVPAVAAPAVTDAAPAGGLAIVSPGLQSLIQDLGRPGLGGLGVSAAGAVDPSAARAANRLVGNQRGDAVVENLMGSLILRAATDQVLAVTGARVELTVSSDEHPARHPAQNAPFALLAGETLELSPALTGLRCYVGVRGGVAGPLVLGSRSSDVLSGIGPLPLAAGDTIVVGTVSGMHVVGAPEPSTLPELPGDGVTSLRFTAGPREDWFGPAGLASLSAQSWRVSTESNRIGVRLGLDDGGTALTRIREGELASEGVVWGALQVPPSGLPVLFLADHPVTGGYPVIGVVVPEDLPAAAQLTPGSRVRFIMVDPDTLAPQPTRPSNLARLGDCLAGHQQGSH
ncbi:carboxyltransferase domain-containing protein [Arthrobacter glacialis]|uniref:Urea amidolyase n=1 Tax=Arthrobacter glacialis TaxID=1664 RepID=A0A2S3ZZT7_ARTGL|nr:carboxyltransferase domain-containing protein [Arthrobacter glacialis]POH60098.1 urea amidolyase [Arthrobacter glacialis]POH74760.1 urea amidolyase [Arthrobacter glacialis]